jgi:hypothetical protein
MFWYIAMAYLKVPFQPLPKEIKKIKIRVTRSLVDIQIAFLKNTIQVCSVTTTPTCSIIWGILGTFLENAKIP